jgi:hypothetical protein
LVDHACLRLGGLISFGLQGGGPKGKILDNGFRA